MGSVDYMFRKLSETIHPISRSSRPPASNKHYGEQPVVILIPGYLYPRPIMRPLETRFKRAAYQVDMLSDAVYERCSFEEQHRRLVEVVCARISSQKPPSDLVIIGHAIGGLHAYKLATRLLDHNVYRGTIKVIALGTPFTHIRKTFFQDHYLRVGLALRGATSLLLPTNGLYYGPHTRLKIFTIAANDDETVPRRMATLPVSESHDILETSHAGLIYHKHVFEHMLNYLKV